VFFLVVIDSFGVGAEPDWAEYGDDPSLNTALHVIDDRPSPSFLWSRGLGYLLKEEPIKQPSVVAKLQELSKGKDSTTGHWEIAGLVMTTPFPTYPHGFPPEVMEEFERRIGTKTLGNFPASGTEIIKQLGKNICALVIPLFTLGRFSFPNSCSRRRHTSGKTCIGCARSLENFLLLATMPLQGS